MELCRARKALEAAERQTIEEKKPEKQKARDPNSGIDGKAKKVFEQPLF